MRLQMFDFESYDDWWCNVIGLLPEEDDFGEEVKDNFLVFTSDDYDSAKRMIDVLCNPEVCNVGYNIKGYDNIILNAIANGCTPHEVNMISNLIIHEDLQYNPAYKMYVKMSKKRFYHDSYIYQDEFDDSDGSLKARECALGLDIRETDVPFTKTNLTPEEKAEIISYCKHDVWSSMKNHCLVAKSYVDTKLAVGKVFNIPERVCYRSTNAKLSALVLGAEKTSFADAFRPDIDIPANIKDYVYYSLPRHIVEHLRTSREVYEVKLFGNVVTYANGGVHSYLEKALIVETTDEWVLLNADASSFYPATLINFKTLSRTVKHPERFRQIYEERLELKKYIEYYEDKYGKHDENADPEEKKRYKESKMKAAAYKLILNTTYGASGNPYLDLYDPYTTTLTCRLGQMLLTSLANNLYNQVGPNNIKIIQTNTDGILCYVRRSKLDLLYKVCDMFTKLTNIFMEFEEEKKIWQKDVNNYLMIKKSGKEKPKGGFFVASVFMPGYNKTRPLDCFVCKEAIRDLLVEGRPLEDHIRKETDISKFVIACNKGVYSGIHREFNDGRPAEPLYKCNRAYASTDESLGIIYKTRRFKGKESKTKSAGCPNHCGILNADLRSYNFAEISKTLDYSWYVNEAKTDLTWDKTKKKPIVWKALRGEILTEVDILGGVG